MRPSFVPRSGVTSTPNYSERGITMSRYSKEEAVEVLNVSKAKLEKATTRDEALEILKEAGKEVSYTPAFRCLVMGQTPEESIKWN
jgi:hypothetical protein